MLRGDGKNPIVLSFCWLPFFNCGGGGWNPVDLFTDLLVTHGKIHHHPSTISFFLSLIDLFK